MTRKKECKNLIDNLNLIFEVDGNKKRIAMISQSSVYTINKGIAWYKKGDEVPCWYSASNGQKETFRNWTECYYYLRGIYDNNSIEIYL